MRFLFCLIAVFALTAILALAALPVSQMPDGGLKLLFQGVLYVCAGVLALRISRACISPPVRRTRWRSR